MAAPGDFAVFAEQLTAILRDNFETDLFGFLVNNAGNLVKKIPAWPRIKEGAWPSGSRSGASETGGSITKISPSQAASQLRHLRHRCEERGTIDAAMSRSGGESECP